MDQARTHSLIRHAHLLLDVRVDVAFTVSQVMRFTW